MIDETIKATNPLSRESKAAPDEREQQGRAARAKVPRTSQSSVDAGSQRDVVALLEEDAPSRIPDLLPIRYGRMLVSPFTFYRGSAIVMAKDLARTPHTGLTVQLCGDAHLANFGGFASPERTFVFDLNDFDETLPGPFEWDVKRLATSIEVAGRDRNFTAAERRNAVLASVDQYSNAMRAFATQGDLDVWYARLDSEGLRAELKAAGDRKQDKVLKKTETKARTKDSMKAFSRLTEVVDGERRIVSDPPLLTPVRELVDRDQDEIEEEITGLLGAYQDTLPGDRRHLVEGYRYLDLARKVVGIGSVGTRCWIVLLVGRDDDDPLFLQVKEAGESVLEPALERSRFANRGQRIVEGQRLMQASSDIFLGWIHNERGLDGVARDFYVRQLWDWKASADLEAVIPRGLELYGRACAWTLARAHARSGDRIAIAAYLGKGDVFSRAVAEFADAYADLNQRDYGALADARREGRIVAKDGL